MLLNVLRRQLTYEGQAETNAEAWFNIALRPLKPDGQPRTATSTLTQLLDYDPYEGSTRRYILSSLVHDTPRMTNREPVVHECFPFLYGMYVKVHATYKPQGLLWCARAP